MAECTTGANGRCTVARRYRKVKSSVTFTVTSFAFAGSTYAAKRTHDPNADSDGTSIVVAKP